MGWGRGKRDAKQRSDILETERRRCCANSRRIFFSLSLYLPVTAETHVCGMFTKCSACAEWNKTRREKRRMPCQAEEEIKPNVWPPRSRQQRDKKKTKQTLLCVGDLSLRAAACYSAFMRALFSVIRTDSMSTVWGSSTLFCQKIEEVLEGLNYSQRSHNPTLTLVLLYVRRGCRLITSTRLLALRECCWVLFGVKW